MDSELIGDCFARADAAIESLRVAIERSDVWDPKDAFRPGSVRFGWMVNPVAIVIAEDDMDGREKVLHAVDRLRNREQDVTKAAANLHTMNSVAAEARADLIRTLKAVYGGRAEKGVVVGGELYRVRDGQLIVERVEFEVLA